MNPHDTLVYFYCICSIELYEGDSCPAGLDRLSRQFLRGILDNYRTIMICLLFGNLNGSNLQLELSELIDKHRNQASWF